MKNGTITPDGREPIMSAYPLVNYLSLLELETPVKIGIDLHSFRRDPKGNGKDKRFFRIYAEGRDITNFIADLLEQKLSTARNTYGCLIVTGSDGDVMESLVKRICSRMAEEGYPDIFYQEDYTDMHFDKVRKR